MKTKKTVALILHNIRSNHNVGSIFRTADCAGVSKIYLTGYTPAPNDKFNRPVKEISKVALGAEHSIPWLKEKNISKVLKKLKAEGFQIIAIEQSKNSIDYKKTKIKFPAVFILGNEVKGLDKKILGECDVIAEIPMYGGKESLNVSVAAGVAIFQMLKI